MPDRRHVRGHHSVQNTLWKIMFSGPNTWSEQVDWMLKERVQRRNPSISPHWISRSVVKLIPQALCFSTARPLLHGGLPWSPEASHIFKFFSQHVFGIVPSLSKNQDLGRVNDCKIICENMGWNDSQRDAPTAFTFVLNKVLFSTYRVHQTHQLLTSEKEMLGLVES